MITKSQRYAMIKKKINSTVAALQPKVYASLEERDVKNTLYRWVEEASRYSGGNCHLRDRIRTNLNPDNGLDDPELIELGFFESLVPSGKTWEDFNKEDPRLCREFLQTACEGINAGILTY